MKGTDDDMPSIQDLLDYDPNDPVIRASDALVADGLVVGSARLWFFLRDNTHEFLSPDFHTPDGKMFLFHTREGRTSVWQLRD